MLILFGVFIKAAIKIIGYRKKLLEDKSNIETMLWFKTENGVKIFSLAFKFD